MVKIQKAKNGQYRVGIPKEIIDPTGWDNTTEVIFIPYLNSPCDSITSETPILIKKISKIDVNGDEVGEQ